MTGFIPEGCLDPPLGKGKLYNVKDKTHVGLLYMSYRIMQAKMDHGVFPNATHYEKGNQASKFVSTMSETESRKGQPENLRGGFSVKVNAGQFS